MEGGTEDNMKVTLWAPEKGGGGAGSGGGGTDVEGGACALKQIHTLKDLKGRVAG